jgi:hypothetical protein
VLSHDEVFAKLDELLALGGTLRRSMEGSTRICH